VVVAVAPRLVNTVLPHLTPPSPRRPGAICSRTELYFGGKHIKLPIYLHPWSSPSDQLKAYDGYPDILGPTCNWTCAAGPLRCGGADW
jgi:hypothetical protein